MKVAIIGAGLAGTSCAYVLKRAGLTPVIYDAADSIAAGASGNWSGLYNPRFSAERTAQSDFYTAAFSMAVRTFKDIGGIAFKPHGALHLMTDDKKATRFPQTVKNWGWEREHMRIVNAKEASEIAGIEIGHDALYLPNSGAVSPVKLCAAYAEGVEVHLGAHVEDPRDLECDAVILANGFGALKFAPDLPLGQVRGQITQMRGTPLSQALKCAVCYSGYMTPADDEGLHTVGSTFQRWLNHSDIMPEDDQDNIEKMLAALPVLGGGAGAFEVTHHRAAVRTTAKDHFPVAGRMPGMDNVYVSTAHASHGVLSSLMAAHVIKDMITGQPLPISNDSAAALSAARF